MKSDEVFHTVCGWIQTVHSFNPQAGSQQQEAFRNANVSLASFYVNEVAWEVSLKLLQSGTEQFMMYGVNVLVQKFTEDRLTLSSDKLKQLLSHIVQTMTEHIKATSIPKHSIAHKLARVLTVGAATLSSTNSLSADYDYLQIGVRHALNCLRERSQSYVLLSFLYLLQAFASEAHSGLALSKNEQKWCCSHLSFVSEEVGKVLETVLRNPERFPHHFTALALDSIKALSSVKTPRILSLFFCPGLVQATMRLLPLVFDSSYNLIQGWEVKEYVDIREKLSSAVVALIKSDVSDANKTVLEAVSISLANTSNAFEAAKQQPDDEVCRCICTITSAFCEAFPGFVVKGSEGAIRLINLQLLCVGHPRSVISEIALDSWLRFQDISQAERHPLFTGPIFVNLLRILLIHEGEDQEAERRWRLFSKDIVASTFTGIGPAEFMNTLTEVLRNTEAEWKTMDSVLFMLSSIAEHIGELAFDDTQSPTSTEDEKRIICDFLSRVFRQLMTLGDSHAPLLASSCKFFADYTFWIRTDQALIYESVQFLLRCCAVMGLKNRASVEFERFSKKLKCVFAGDEQTFRTYFQLTEQTISQLPRSFKSLRHLVRSLSVVAIALPDGLNELKQEVLKNLLTYAIQRIQISCSVEGKDDPSLPNPEQALQGYISVITAILQEFSSDRQLLSCAVNCLDQVYEALQFAAQTFGAKEEVVKEVCGCYTAIIKGIGVDADKRLPEVVSVSGKVVIEFAIPEAMDVLLNATIIFQQKPEAGEYFVQVGGQILQHLCGQDEESFKGKYDILPKCFNMLERIMDAWKVLAYPVIAPMALNIVSRVLRTVTTVNIYRAALKLVASVFARKTTCQRRFNVLREPTTMLIQEIFRGMLDIFPMHIMQRVARTLASIMQLSWPENELRALIRDAIISMQSGVERLRDENIVRNVTQALVAQRSSPMRFRSVVVGFARFLRGMESEEFFNDYLQSRKSVVFSGPVISLT